MSTLYMVLSCLIRDKKVTVDIPNLNMDELIQAIENRGEFILREIADCTVIDDWSDEKKVREIQRILHEAGYL